MTYIFSFSSGTFMRLSLLLDELNFLLHDQQVTADFAQNSYCCLTYYLR